LAACRKGRMAARRCGLTADERPSREPGSYCPDTDKALHAARTAPASSSAKARPRLETAKGRLAVVKLIKRYGPAAADEILFELCSRMAHAG
jgi:hypothetical protein